MMHLNIEELTFFRGRSSIDLEAIFGGHISGRRLRGVKINPIFHDPEHCYSAPISSEVRGELDDSSEENPIHIDVYESLPRARRLSRLQRQAHSASDLLDLDSSSVELSPNWNISNRKLGFEHQSSTMKDEHQDTDMEKSDSSLAAIQKDDLCQKNETSIEENVPDKTSPVNSNEEVKKDEQCSVEEKTKDIEAGPESSEKDNANLDAVDTGSPSRRLSDSSMIVYEDVDQSSFPMLTSVISHLSSYKEDPPGPDVQENILLYTSDGDSPTNDLMSVPSSDWPSVDDLALHQESEASEGNSEPLPQLPSPSSKPLRPILLSSTSNDDSNAFPKSPNLSPSEHKTVTFAKDTVFNEDKPKRYQKEKINLKELYHERVCGRGTGGMVNPVFVISDEKLTIGETAGICLTDDEKAKRHSFKLNLVSSVSTTSESASANTDTSSPQTLAQDLNTPAYLQKFLARSSSLDKARETTRTASDLGQSSTSSLYPYDMSENDIEAATDIILELPQETPEETHRKRSRRRRVLKWTVSVFAMVVFIVGVLALVIYFSNKSRGDSDETTLPPIL